MKRLVQIITLLGILVRPAVAQTASDTVVYLLTCTPGTETYSIYGHSALRITIEEKGIDDVYNWGLFDFSTPHFAWKFAKGRLEYRLGVETLNRFLQTYLLEQRSVYSQIINLEPYEIERLMDLIEENLRPENLGYKYDFFYDDCSTRIRDLLEKSIGDKLLYPPAEIDSKLTFRDMLSVYQSYFPWLKYGIDLLMGSPGDKKVSFRDRMFLPIDMQNGLADSHINRQGKMIPLLSNPELLLGFDQPDIRQNLFTTPLFTFTLLLIIIIILSAVIKNRYVIKLFDIIIFSVFSLLALLMIFFNFFTDHQQMKWNLNIIWLNPFIIICLLLVILNKTGTLWFRIVFLTSLGFLVIHLVLPQEINNANFPLMIILALRTSVRADYEWNPFALQQQGNTT